MNNIIDIRQAAVRMLARAANPRPASILPGTPALRRAPLVMAWVRDPTNGTLVARWSNAISEADKARAPVAPVSRSRRGTPPPRRKKTRYGRRV